MCNSTSRTRHCTYAKSRLVKINLVTLFNFFLRRFLLPPAKLKIRPVPIARRSLYTKQACSNKTSAERYASSISSRFPKNLPTNTWSPNCHFTRGLLSRKPRPRNHCWSTSQKRCQGTLYSARSTGTEHALFCKLPSPRCLINEDRTCSLCTRPPNSRSKRFYLVTLWPNSARGQDRARLNIPFPAFQSLYVVQWRSANMNFDCHRVGNILATMWMAR